MKRLFNILIIIVVYMIFCGKSCDDDGERINRQSHQASLAKDSILHDFETDFLTEEARYASGVNAMQKLNDLADYMEIYADRSLEPAFREKAGDMINKMFRSPDNHLFLGPVRKEKMTQITLEEFLEKGFGDEFIRVRINFDSVKVIEPLVLKGERNYSGKMSAYQSMIGFTANDSLILPARRVTIDFFSTRQVKTFGSDSIEVRVVRLGDIYLEK
ncbi:MAG: hypothetical protein KBC43_12885 [Bacteroidales bacterium]|nr:hypothetical protein [Bacteroidales bacterium]